ncbi:MAG: BCCT family transporter [Myxococcota bacterium]
MTELRIETADAGFYRGFSHHVTITSKLLVFALVLWAVAFPEQASAILKGLNRLILGAFATWYMAALAVFLLASIVLAIWPRAAKLRLGKESDRPEFSRFSWFSMMFGAGIGMGMLTYAAAEPIAHVQNSPEIIRGLEAANSVGAARAAMKWSFFHWGFSAWAAYGVCGLTLAFFAHRRGLPLTIRSSLAALFGERLSGKLGHTFDVVAVVATVLGVAQTLGYGVEQFVAGLGRLGLGNWLLVSGADGTSSASPIAIIVSLTVIVGASTASALSGVGRGIKWLSNLNLGLSFFLLAFFVLFGSTAFALRSFALGMWDYVSALPFIMVEVYSEQEGAAAQWQGAWTIFYWAWWISFAPFVGLFLARISKGRTIREFILGAILAPSAMCFVWFALVGGTAIDLELTGQAAGAIFSTGLSDQLYAVLGVLSGGFVTVFLYAVVVVLLLTYLVTSADSAILIINTINAAGDEGPKARPHILFWGAAFGFVVGTLLLAGGLEAIQTAMVIGALPFSFVMVLMVASLFRAISREAS